MHLTPKKRKIYTRRKWAVETAHGLTQNSITGYLAQHGGAGYGATDITYLGKTIHVYLVPFFAIEWLENMKVDLGLQFVLYYQEPKMDDWSKWREEEKTTEEKLNQNIKSGVIRRGAMQFRQTYKRKV